MLKDAVHWDELTSSDKNDFSVDSRDNGLQYHYNRYMNEPSAENQEALEAELAHRSKTDKIFADLFPRHLETIKNKEWPLPTDFVCLRKMVDNFETHCEKLTDYSLKWVSAFVTECEGMKSMTTQEMESHYNNIQATCNSTIYWFNWLLIEFKLK